MILRKHQQETSDVVDGIKSGSQIKRIIESATPGAGKSLIPVIAGRLIPAGLADAIAWVVPRLSLAHQAEASFKDPFFRNGLKHRLSIRASTNDINPCRGTDGFVTTYQAIGQDDRETVLRDFKRKRYILVLDEPHHVEKGGPWEKALAPLVAEAKYLIMMSGTLERGDKSAIAFLKYNESDLGYQVDDSASSDTAFIRYSRSDALRERAILPLVFHCHDGAVKWMTDNGREVSYESMAAAKIKDSSAAVYTAISTKYAEELLTRGMDHWQRHVKEINPYSKIMIVTASVRHAKEAAGFLKRMGFVAPIATSHDSVSAQREIKRFRVRQDANIIVAVNMVYEGLDVPSATHIISLTHIRSVPWIEQEVARVVRIDKKAGPYEHQCGHVFCPDDPVMRSVITRIREEQASVIDSISGREAATTPEQLPIFDGPKLPWTPGGIIPIGSHVTSNNPQMIGLDAGNGPDRTSCVDVVVLTESEREERLRKKIDAHVKAYARDNRYKPVRINREIKDRFGKAREQMTRPELERLLAYLEKYYRLDSYMGASRPVPTKAIMVR
jgi:superfamily II DNA or RNA helicase